MPVPAFTKVRLEPVSLMMPLKVVEVLSPPLVSVNAPKVPTLSIVPAPAREPTVSAL